MDRWAAEQDAPVTSAMLGEHQFAGWARCTRPATARCCCGALFPADSLVVSHRYQAEHASQCRTHSYASSEVFGRIFFLYCTCGRDFSSTDVIEACAEFVAHIREYRRWWAER